MTDISQTQAGCKAKSRRNPLWIPRAIPHNSKCRYGERGAADAKPKAQIILDAAKVSAASGGNSEPKQGQRSQSARGFCPRSTMRVPQPDIIEHFGNADAVPQPPERCLSRQAGIVRCCLYENVMASNAKPSGFCNCTSGFALQTDGHCPSSGPPKRACGRSALRMLIMFVARYKMFCRERS